MQLPFLEHTRYRSCSSWKRFCWIDTYDYRKTTLNPFALQKGGTPGWISLQVCCRHEVTQLVRLPQWRRLLPMISIASNNCFWEEKSSSYYIPQPQIKPNLSPCPTSSSYFSEIAVDEIYFRRERSLNHRHRDL